MKYVKPAYLKSKLVPFISKYFTPDIYFARSIADFLDSKDQCKLRSPPVFGSPLERSCPIVRLQKTHIYQTEERAVYELRDYSGGVIKVVPSEDGVTARGLDKIFSECNNQICVDVTEIALDEQHNRLWLYALYNSH